MSRLRTESWQSQETLAGLSDQLWNSRGFYVPRGKHVIPRPIQSNEWSAGFKRLLDAGRAVRCGRESEPAHRPADADYGSDALN